MLRCLVSSFTKKQDILNHSMKMIIQFKQVKELNTNIPLSKIIDLREIKSLPLSRFLIKFKFVLFRKTIRVAFRNARRYNLERT